MIDCFMGDSCGVLSCPFWITVLQCGARLPIHTLTTERCSQRRQFFNRRSVAVFCMLCKIRCNPMHPLYGALPVLLQVTRGAVIAHRYTYAPPRCRTSKYRRTFIPLSVSLWNDHSDPVFDGVGLAGFKSRANSFLWA